MQKVLLSMILALFMALALVGVKRIVTPATTTPGTVMIADGPGQLPPTESF